MQINPLARGYFPQPGPQRHRHRDVLPVWNALLQSGTLAVWNGWEHLQSGTPVARVRNASHVTPGNGERHLKWTSPATSCGSLPSSEPTRPPRQLASSPPSDAASQPVRPARPWLAQRTLPGNMREAALHGIALAPPKARASNAPEVHMHCSAANPPKLKVLDL